MKTKQAVRNIVKDIRCMIGNQMTGVQMDGIANRIDEYAKQQSIAFAVYLGGIMDGSVKAKINTRGTTAFDDIYTQFIEHQSLNK